MNRILLTSLVATAAVAEMPTIPAMRGNAAEGMDPAAAVWKSLPPVQLALHRTPPLYAPDSPGTLEIPTVQIQVLVGAGKRIVRLARVDGTRDADTLAQPKNVWQSETQPAQSEATGRFFDVCAVMLPAGAGVGGLFPSLQMGDADHPVAIYYYDMARGPAAMEALGRGATRRTGRIFPARALYANGRWQVTLELPEIPAGIPLALAVWNGSQGDRGGRKYFSIWYRTR